MSISFSGLGSGMDYSSWITQLVAIKMESVTNLENQQKTLNTKKTTLDSVRSTFTTLSSSLQTLSDAKFGGEMDIFNANTATTSDSKYLNVSVTNSATRQDLSVFVKQLATTTTATSNQSMGKQISEDTVFLKLANSNAKTGTFSIYLDNQRHEIEITEEDTLGNIKEKLENLGANVKIEDGKFSISYNGELSLGSHNDNSNFATILGLTTLDEETNSYTSKNPVTELNSSSKILAEDSGFAQGLTAGTFKIGNATFEIDENTTLTTLINQINTSTESGVQATFDYTSGKLILNSKTTGSMNINIEAGTSNITDVLGFTTNGSLVAGSQIKGQNAEVIINGNEVTSFSNTITSDVTGLSGVTLNLTAPMSEGTENTHVSIKQDSDKIVDAIKKAFNDLNTVFDKIDTTTEASADYTAALAYESQLTNLKTSLRTFALERQELDDGTYSSLASIGITTGEIGASVDADTNKFTIDEKKLREALENNPNEVKELLVGTDSSGKDGAINKMLESVKASLDSTGYFTTRTTSIDSEISTLTDKISTKKDQILAYQERLTKQFQAMDSAIAKLQEQFNSLPI